MWWRSASADQRAHVLVDHQDRLALALQPVEARPDLVADQRRQPLGRLVEDQQLGVGHQRPADRQHLLLAAGELVAHVALALGQARKEAEGALERPGIAARGAVGGRRQKVLAHREVGEDLAALGHQAEAEAGDAEGGQVIDPVALELDDAAARRQQAHDGIHGRRLAHAVAAHQGHHLAGIDGELHAEQRLARAVEGRQLADPQHHADLLAEIGLAHVGDWRGSPRACRWRWRGHRPAR